MDSSLGEFVYPAQRSSFLKPAPWAQGVISTTVSIYLGVIQNKH
jgi:hypothetical protein